MLQTGGCKPAYARRDMGKPSRWQHLGVPVDEARNPSYNALRLAVGDFMKLYNTSNNIDPSTEAIQPAA